MSPFLTILFFDEDFITIYTFYIAGMTLGKVMLKVSQKEWSPGLLYTGASRVTCQSDLMIEGHENIPRFPTLQRFMNMRKSNAAKLKKKEGERKSALYDETRARDRANE